jgi:hypothetical protein
MPYSILTRDGIQITNIPNDIPSDSEILKSRVADERRKLQIVVSQDVVTEPSGVPGGTVEEQRMAAESEIPTLDTAGNVIMPPPVEREPDSSLLSEVTGGVARGLAPVGAGMLAGGVVGGLPGALFGAAAGSLAPVIGDPIVRTINNFLGTDFTEPTVALEQFLTKIGVTDPQTEAGRIVEAIASGAAGAGGVPAAGKYMMGAADDVLGTAQRVGSSLASQPAAQIVSGAAAGGTAQGVQEAGGGPSAQLISSLLAAYAAPAVAARVPRIISEARTPQPQSLTDTDLVAAEAARIPVMTSDVRPPRTFAGKSARQLGERIPYIGTGPIRQKQQEARIESVRDLLRKYGADDAASLSDDVMKDLATQRSSFITKFVNQKNQVLNKIAGRGNVEIPRTIQRIDGQIARLQSLSRGPEGIKYDALIDDLERTKYSLQDQDILSIEELRGFIGERYKSGSLADVSAQAQKVYNSLYKPLVDDMGEFIQKSGDAKDYNKWKIANKRLSESIDELKIGGLKSALSKGEATPETIEKLLFSKKPSEVRLLYKNLSEDGRGKARGAILARAAEKVASEEATGTVISPDQFKRQVQALGTSVGVMFRGSDLDQVSGLMRILNLTKRASEAGASPMTGVQNFYQILGMGLPTGYYGGASGLIQVASSMSAFSAFTRAYESAPVRNILIRLAKTKSGSKEEAAVFKRMFVLAQQMESEDVEQVTEDVKTLGKNLGL